MRDIREIAIIVDAVRNTIGHTLELLKGSISDTTSSRGSLDNFMNFDKEMRKIRGAIGTYAKEYIKPTEVKEDNAIQEYIKMVDEYLILKDTVDENLSKLNIPFDNNPALEYYGKILYGRDKDHIGFKEFNNLIDTSPKIKGPSDSDLTDIMLGKYDGRKTCPDGSQPCVNSYVNPEDSPVMQMIQSIWGNAICTLKMIIPMMPAVIMRIFMPYLKNLHDSDKWVRYLKLLPILAIPSIGIISYGIALLSSTTWYGKISFFFCKMSTNCDYTFDDSYKNICELGNFQDHVIIFTADGNYYATSASNIISGYDILEDNDFSSLFSSPKDYNILTTNDDNNLQLITVNLTYHSSYTFDPFSLSPIFLYHESLFTDNNPEISTELLDNIKDSIENRTYFSPVMMDGDTPMFAGSADMSKPNICHTYTEAAFAIIYLQLFDMIFYPDKYNIRIPDMITYMMIKQNFDSLAGLGNFLAMSAEGGEKDDILDKMSELYNRFGKTYKDVTNFIFSEGGLSKPVDTTADAISNWSESLRGLAAVGRPAGQVTSIALYEIYRTLNIILTPSSIINIACCFISHLVSASISAGDYHKMKMTAEDIKNKINNILKFISQALQLTINITGNNYTELIKKYLNNIQNTMLSAISSAITMVYGTVKLTIDTWINKLGQSWSAESALGNAIEECLPWFLLKSLFRKMIQVILNRVYSMFQILFAQLENMIKYNMSAMENISLVATLQTYKFLCDKLMVNLDLLYECIYVSNDPIDSYDDLIRITKPTGPFDPFDPDDGEDGEDREDREDREYSETTVGDTNMSDFAILAAASIKSGRGIYINKNKLSKLLENLSDGDPVAIASFVNEVNGPEIFENRLAKCDCETVRTLQDILDYYNVR